MAKLCEGLSKNNVAIKIWSIPLGDKANAWNAAIHDIYEGEDLAIFMDGYVMIKLDALDNLSEALIDSNHALAASGTPPLDSKTLALRNQMLNSGGFHGNLCALNKKTISQLRLVNARIPVGIYRTDSTLGAFISFNLDPTKNDWDTTRILVNASATWDANVRKITNINDITSQFKRVVRQSKGIIENKAVKDLLAFKKTPIHLLPSSAHSLCRQWCFTHKAETFYTSLKNPFVIPFILSLFKKQHIPQESLKPDLIASLPENKT